MNVMLPMYCNRKQLITVMDCFLLVRKNLEKKKLLRIRNYGKEDKLMIRKNCKFWGRTTAPHCTSLHLKTWKTSAGKKTCRSICFPIISLHCELVSEFHSKAFVWASQLHPIERAKHSDQSFGLLNNVLLQRPNSWKDLIFFENFSTIFRILTKDKNEIGIFDFIFSHLFPGNSFKK